MSITSDDLKKRYASYSDENLLEVLYNKNEYTPEAIEAVTAEIATRKIDSAQLKSFTDEQEKIAADKETAFQIGIITPLTFGEKLLYFFAWFAGPFIAGAFQMNYREDYLLLKLKQSRSFKWAGIAGLMITVFIGVQFEFRRDLSLLIYAAMFFLFNEIEKRYFKYSFERE